MFSPEETQREVNEHPTFAQMLPKLKIERKHNYCGFIFDNPA